MYDDKNWESDAFAGADYSRHSLTELFVEIKSIVGGVEDGMNRIQKEIAKINTKYPSILQRYFKEGDIGEFFKEPLKLLRLTVEELTEILDEIKQDKVSKTHIRRLKDLGEVGAKDFHSWVGAQPPQIGDDYLMSDIFNLGDDISRTLAGSKVLAKLGVKLETYLDCKLRSTAARDKQVNSRATKQALGQPGSIKYRNLITDVYEASATSIRYGEGKVERFNGRSQLGDLWYFLLCHVDKKLQKKRVMTAIKLGDKEQLKKTIENLIEKLVRVSHLPRSEIKSWFEIQKDALCLKS